MSGFSPVRLFAMLIKESLQMRRDRATVGLTVMLPLVQLFLFGYAINANPRHLPTGLLSAEHSTYERTLAAALQNTRYFDIQPMATEEAAEQALARGDVMFVLNIPPDFSRRIDRGERWRFDAIGYGRFSRRIFNIAQPDDAVRARRIADP